MVNFQSIALLSPFFISFVFFILIANTGKLKEELPFRMLVVFYVNTVIFGISLVAISTDNIDLFKHTFGFFCFTMLAFHPVVFLYIKSVIRYKLGLLDFVLHLLPSAILLLTYALVFLFLNETEVDMYFEHVLYGAKPVSFSEKLIAGMLSISRFIHGLQAIVYFLLIKSMLKRHQVNIDQVFSQTKGLRLSWLFSFNVIYTISSVMGVLSNLFPTEYIIENNINNMVMINIAAFALFLGAKGINQVSVGYVVNTLDRKVESVVIEQEDNSNEFLLIKIDNFIIKQKAFLNPELKIWDVVEATGINRTYVSKAINEKYKTSFSQYINNLRVEEACKLINKNLNESFDAIAEESGFNSIASFNRAIKKFKGLTPSEIRNKVV